MRKLLIFTIFVIFLISVPTAEANHLCGQDCNQYTEQGACTHGCYAGGAANPDFRDVKSYEQSTNDWTNTYNQIKQQEQDAANLAERQRIANETAAAAQAAADAEAAATAATRVRMAAEAAAAEAAATEAQARLQRAKELNEIQTAHDKSLISSGSCMACVNCPDDHLHPWCAQIPGGHNPDSPAKGNGDNQTLFTTNPNNPDALKDEATRIINYNQSNNIVGKGGVSNYFVKADGNEAYFITKDDGSIIVSDTPNPVSSTSTAKNGVEASWKDPANFKAGGACFGLKKGTYPDPKTNQGLACGGGATQAFCVPSSIWYDTDGGSKTCNDYIKENYNFYYVGWMGDAYGWDVNTQCYDSPGTLWVCNGEIVSKGCGPSNSVSHSTEKCIPKDKSVCGKTFQLDIGTGADNYRSIYYSPDWCSGTTTTTLVAPILTPSVGGAQAQSNTPVVTDTPVAPQCNQACGSGCPSNLTCVGGVCRNPSCTGEASCTCPGSTFQCQQLQILRGGVVITPSQILLNDNIVFRGFASATNTTVSSMLFTLTINGIAQTPVSKPATLVGTQYQADYPYIISQATSYSASVSPVSP